MKNILGFTLNKYQLISIVLSVVIFGLLAAVSAIAWTNPTAAPPGGGGALFFSGGNVGIGTTAPAARLHSLVVGTNPTRPGGTWAGLIENTVDATGQHGLSVATRWGASGSTVFEVASYWGANVEVYTPILTVRGDRNVGIGITAPTGRLHVRGGNTYIDNINFGGTPTIALAVGDTDTGLHSTADGALDIFSNNIRTMSIRNANVGIGTSTPAFTLDVWGSARVRDTLIIPVK